MFVCEPLNLVDTERGRGSLHSIRRGSLDVRSIASDGLRRTSLAKLQGLPLEAPITKASISIIIYISHVYQERTLRFDFNEDRSV